MNWEAIGAIGDLLGGVGVIVSIVYLAVQIRANTRATKGSASFAATHSWAHTNEWLAQLPDEQMLLFSRCLEPDARTEDFSDAEHVRIQLALRAIYQKLEGQYYLARHGLLDPGMWRGRSRVARGMIEQPLLRAWWENELRNATFSEEFVSALLRATPIDGSTVNRPPPRT